MRSTRTQLNLESLDQRIVPARIDLRVGIAQAQLQAQLNSGVIAHQMSNAWDTANGSQSHGTGALETYLTVDADGIERGYNTDFRPVQFDASSDPLATRALPLAEVPVVTVGGIQYREFVLNVDQTLVAGDRQLSVDEIQVFTSTLGNLRNYNNANNTLRAGTTIESPVWNLDLEGNDWLQVRAVTNQGTQAGELALLIPNDLFSPSETFVYIYSRMGVNRDANAGAEEWGVRGAPPAGGTASLSGTVYVDPDQQGPGGEGEVLLVGIRMVLFDVGFVEIAETFTDSFGNYSFNNLEAGTYHIFQDLDEQSHPEFLGDGLDYPGTVNDVENGASDGDDTITGIVLADGDVGINYDFTEVLGE